MSQDKSRQELQQERDFLFDLCEHAHDLMQSVSSNGRFLYVNRAWRETLGYEESEVSELRLMKIIHPDDRRVCIEILERLNAGEPGCLFESDLIAKDGRRVPVEGSVTARRKDGRLVATRAILRNMTSQVETRQELDRLFELSLDLLCVAGIDGFFKHINPAFEQVLGYSREELLSRAFIEFVHPDDRDATIAEVNRLAEGQLVIDFQNRYLAKDGKYRWLAWKSAPLPERGLVYAVARDITKQKEIQEFMDRQARELARSNADLEQFAYAASHDLRAPLRSITNLSDWIEEDLGEQLSQDVYSHLQKLRGQLVRMERLTEDLLAYSKAGHSAYEVTTVDCGELVEEIVRLLAPSQDFTVTCQTRLPVLETVCPALEQVFRNLIGNALDHHNRVEGRVEIAARKIDGFFEFSICDDGPGIAPKHHQDIFTMFHRLAHRKESSGSGLGLALVKRIVERFGGSVWVESKPNEGATFYFTWPQTVQEDYAQDLGG